MRHFPCGQLRERIAQPRSRLCEASTDQFESYADVVLIPVESELFPHVADCILSFKQVVCHVPIWLDHTYVVMPCACNKDVTARFNLSNEAHHDLEIAVFPRSREAPMRELQI